MKISYSILFVIFFIIVSAKCYADDSLNIKGQASAWLNVNPDIDIPLYSGVRYIPTLNYEISFKKSNLIDFEASGNINGSVGIHPFDSVNSDGNIKPYRLWLRYSANQFEVRLGLQKINFGSANLLRPLMWFDQLDPRDPLQLTNGVWGLLGRYYFINNANIWLWMLYGNDKPKTWEIGNTNKKYPEIGGRFQNPLFTGEAAISYHFRNVDLSKLDSSFLTFTKIGEHRIGIDGKWDIGIGLWYEGTWINKTKNIGPYTNQEIFNCGFDYTFGIGNGLGFTFEQLLFSYDEKPFQFKNSLYFSGMLLSYPVGMFDVINAMLFYDWTNDALYNFLNWKKDFKNISLYLMAYWNPKDYKMPQQGESANYFAGKGIQLMIVFNH